MQIKLDEHNKTIMNLTVKNYELKKSYTGKTHIFFNSIQLQKVLELFSELKALCEFQGSTITQQTTQQSSVAKTASTTTKTKSSRAVQTTSVYNGNWIVSLFCCLT